MQKLSTLLLAAPVLMRQQAVDAIGRRQNDAVWFLVIIPIAAIIFMGFVRLVLVLPTARSLAGNGYAELGVRGYLEAVLQGLDHRVSE